MTIPMEQIVQSIGSHFAMLPIESRLSLPIVAREKDQLLIRRIAYGTRMVAGKGTTIVPPNLVGEFNYTTGEFLSVHSYQPPNIPVDPNKSASGSEYNPPVFSSPEELMKTYADFYKLYDVLLPAFSKRMNVDDQLRAAARKYIEAFNRLSEPPLHGLYQHEGGEFLDWIRATAR